MGWDAEGGPPPPHALHGQAGYHTLSVSLLAFAKGVTPFARRRRNVPHLHRLFSVVFLALTCAIFCVGISLAAQNPAPAQTAYRAAVTEWHALRNDEKRAAQRDLWLKLENRFLDIAKRDSGDTGAKAQYQSARCREELAKRSLRQDDWQQSANLFLELGKKFPHHALADDGLFNAASIAAKRLNKPNEARDLCRAVLNNYPKGDMTAGARALLSSLGKGDPAKPPAKAGQPAQPTKPTPTTSSAPVAVKPSTQTIVQGPALNLDRVICRGTSTRSTVTLALDGAASYRHKYLAPTSKQPARLMIDIDAVTPDTNVKADATYTGLAVSRIQVSTTGTRAKKNTRVILDLRNVRHYTVESGTNPSGIRVQCSVSPDLPGGRTPPTDGKDGPVVQGNISGVEPIRAGTLMEQLGLTVKTIMLDAGHGGKDPGAMGNGITEKDVTLTLTKLLGDRLKKQGFTVLYTRENDSTVALDQRPVIANNKKADLFISLHVNSSTDKKINGLETYFLDLARTSSAATVAARENAVSVKSISDLQFILTDLMLSSKLQESQDLAAIIHKNMFGRLSQAGFSMNDNGVRSAPFYVLMGARMPAVLVEIGYLSHSDDARRIKSSKYLERLADGVALGVMEYKNKLARFNGK